ncbi:substrate-binding domain-containing protein [Anaerofilum sp. BX8]|uniref:Substrate-binding domain-containing protein n=1 Tax=Anaerofilum hominis TaxID=2763016 RepID=A0A923I8Z9_9FIRM|nr:substrate-binding domain-containing protein [Anaerofilum hominis]MBC5580468.1 substrate-binding domain-containing protein [Anaerofilum hominis]
MKKLLCSILVLCLCMGMAACGGGDGQGSGTPAQSGAAAGGSSAVQSKELEAWTMGCIDPGAWNAAYGPVYDQLEALADALNYKIIYATRASASTDDTLAAVQNLIVSGADALVLGNDVLGCYMQVADICEEAKVYWTMYWAGVSEEDREALNNYKYYVSATYEDEEYAGYWLGKAAGEAGCKNLCLIGAPDGLDFTIRRNKGLDRACEEYGMTILAQERDITLTGSAAGGMDIVNRFLETYPQCDGIIIQGRTHSCLAGVVNGLSDAGKTEDIPIFAIDCNINQTEYFANKQEAGVIGGHHLGGMYNTILLTNIINGTPLTDEKPYLLNHYVELTTTEQCEQWAHHVWDNNAYTGEEILQYIKAYNPQATYEDLVALTESYSLEDIIARHG